MLGVLLTRFPEPVERGAVRVVVAVREVEARHIHAGIDQLAQALHRPARLQQQQQQQASNPAL